MLIGFLIRDRMDWKAWWRSVTEVQGKVIIHVADKAPHTHGPSSERESAVDEVEAFDDDDDDDNNHEDKEDYLEGGESPGGTRQ